MAAASSGIATPESTADYWYQCHQYTDIFTVPDLNQKVRNFITAAENALSRYDEDEIKAFIQSRMPYGYGPELITKYSLVNGYLSVLVGLRYNFGTQDSLDYYYDARTAVFDIYTGKQLALSDLFFDRTDFVPLLNKYLAEAAITPYSGFGATHDMLHDFTGLYEGEFTFTADSIVFRPDTCFADGVSLSIAALSEYMVTSIPRDMTGYIDAAVPVYRIIGGQYSGSIGFADEKNGITIWHLDPDKAPVSDSVCEKVNCFIDALYEEYFTPEKLLAVVTKAGITAESVAIGPFPDFDIALHGNRYISVSGANLGFAQNSSQPYEFTVIEGHYNRYYFEYYFNTRTGESLQLEDLFQKGWTDAAKYYVFDDTYSSWDSSTWVPYTKPIVPDTCRILKIEDYDSAPVYKGELSDLDIPVTVYITTENGDMAAVSVPREYIR